MDQETIEVVASPESQPGQTVLDTDAIIAFPARSADELLRAMPGLHLSAHGGFGKAYQFFLRGFDAVHGGDLAVYLEGIPINEPSNVHGQGYLDLYFLPTSLVTAVELEPGPFRLDAGDFAVAGVAFYHLGAPEPGTTFRVSGGTDRSGSVSADVGGKNRATFAHADIGGGLGVGEGRSYQQGRLAAGWGTGGFRAFTLAYDGRFDSPGVLREADIPTEGFYGAYPEAGGGRSQRVVVGARQDWTGAQSHTRMGLWGQARSLELRHNFTGYLQDEVHGDGRVQTHDALGLGGDLSYEALLGPHHLTLGLAGRQDWMHQTEAGIWPDGTRYETWIDTTIRQSDVGAWAGLDLEIGDWLTASPGGRLAWVDLARQDGAHAHALVPLPRAGLALHLGDNADLFARGAFAYRSPEARGIGESEVAPVMVSQTAELGAALRPGSTELRVSAFGTKVNNELVFDHFAGRFLSSGSTQRIGGEAVVTLHPRPFLRTEVQLTWADGRYVATGEPIPYAPRLLAAVGGHIEGWQRGDWAAWAGLTGWLLGPRPLPDGFVSHPSFVADLTGDLSYRRWRLGLEIDNLLGAHWRDGEFVYPSWFDQDAPRSELPVLHITAGEPFAARISIGMHL